MILAADRRKVLEENVNLCAIDREPLESVRLESRMTARCSSGYFLTIGNPRPVPVGLVVM